MEKKETQIMRGLQLSVGMIENIHIPLESDNQEMKIHFEKFRSMVKNSIGQVVGTKNIQLPSRLVSDFHDLRGDTNLIDEYEKLMLQWADTMLSTINNEMSKPLNCKQSLGVIEYWRLRFTVLNMLYQELDKPEVETVRKLVGEYNDMTGGIGSSAVDDFEQAKKELSKRNGEAKDNVKFLTTLERQFKNLQSNDLNTIEQSLSSLLNGLKLVFIISRHFKTEDRISSLLAIISDEICDKVEGLLSFKVLFKQEEGVSSEDQLNRAIELINQGMKVLVEWKTLFEKTKGKLDGDGGERWDFDPKPITDRPEYMVNILTHFRDVAEILKKYFSFLGPKLKAVVTGNSDKIDQLIEKVKGITKDFEAVGFNMYDKKNESWLKEANEKYKEKVEEIEQQTEDLIETTFKDLRSSESAFELLQDFKNLENLDHISKQLGKKYSNVLETYSKELHENLAIFHKDQKNPNFGKDKPPVSAAIAWKRALTYRIKRPILKFISRPDDWDQNQFKQIKEDYKKFAKELDEYENEEFRKWSENIDSKAMVLLKRKILEKDSKGRFVVGFRPEFQQLIAEARNLEKMGFSLGKSIMNITLQEKEYYKTVDRLKKVLHEYESEVNSLSDVEKDLLSEKVDALTNTLASAAESYNLQSLGISDFILDFRNELKKFRELKHKVEEKKRMIEDIVGQISQTELISRETLRIFFEQELEAKDFMTLTRFSTLITEDIQSISKELIEKYYKIGQTMLPQIEFVVTGKTTLKCEKMRMYYFYWERRVYNALIEMITRGLLTFKSLINRKRSRPIPLFKVSTEFQYMKVITVPHINEIRVTMNNLVKTIKDVAGGFPRWTEGTCKALDISDENLRSNDLARMTFLKDVNDNRVIMLISMEMSELKKMTFERLEKYKSVWEEDKGEATNSYANFKKIIWNQKNKFKIEKIIEKNPSIANFEFFIEYFHGFLCQFKKEKQESNAGFIRVDFSNVKNAFIVQCQESLDRISQKLLNIGVKQADGIKKRIEDYDQSIDQDAKTLKELKQNLNVIRNIRDQTMDIELLIEEVSEKFRILKKFKLREEGGGMQVVDNLKNKWEALIIRTKLIDMSLADKKKEFAVRTKEQVEELKRNIEIMYKEFKERGPGSKGVALGEGLIRLQSFNSQVADLNKQRADLVSSEKLFSRNVSSFPLLTEVEEEMSQLKSLYTFYEDVRKIISSWERVLWSKLDFESFERDKRKLVKRLNDMSKKKINREIFNYIKKEIEEFKGTFPLIEKLKANPDFKESHWEKLMRDIGIPIGDINFKLITLEQVFALKLHNHINKVDEIVNMASQEAQNQIQIQEIEAFWKNAAFEDKDYKRGEDVRGVVIKVDEDIYNNLNEHLVNLQNMESSKYAFTLRGIIKEWVRNLNRIQETVDIWMDVQKKWMYLEGIFIGNDDIKQQLKAITKKFDGYDKSFKKLNNQVKKNTNVFVNCVTIDSTLIQLTLLKGNFENLQSSLTKYLTTKKICFPRFYFISNDDLLGILGNSDIKEVQPHLMKLFDNCKEFLTTRSGTIRGMRSVEGEEFVFQELIKPEGPVEVWMKKFETEMQKSLHRKTKEGIYFYSKRDREKWIQETMGMVTITARQVWWTWRVEDVFSRVRQGDKYAMKDEAQIQSDEVNQLIKMVRSNLEDKPGGVHLRQKVNILIIIDVHARDIVEGFVRDSVLDAKEFQWESQLRFYWLNAINDIEIRQCTGKFPFGYEYQGLSGRLVITPLTDKCVMTLTTALTFKMGGAPAGPAGTGKTETIKDLAKSMGQRNILTNCGETFDSFTMGNNFSGLCQTGFWGIFDEFNRILPEVLSVVSSQIKAIQISLVQGKKTVKMLGKEIALIPTFGCFITMNPEYEGRSELPDNLKALFRPVTMVKPDNLIICENMLMSEGFIEARSLAKKMTVLYKLSFEQLSIQNHYDFGLRGLKSVLVIVGKLKRKFPDLSEERLLMQGLFDMNIPKLVNDDVILFKALLKDLFPKITLEAQTNRGFRDSVVEVYEEGDLELIEDQVNKVVQVNDTMNTRHTVMLVGPSGCGKSAIIDTLGKSLIRFHKLKLQIFPLNPKAQAIHELYGNMNQQTHEWTDGIISHIFKKANSEDPHMTKNKNILKWIWFDGDVDTDWVEYMNSVMDESKILTLSNFDRISLQDNCKLLFEVTNLQHASPATISRSGMVFVDSQILQPLHLFTRWAQQYNQDMEEDEKVSDLLLKLFKKYVDRLLQIIFKKTQVGKDQDTKPQLSIELTPLNLVSQLCKLMDSLMVDHQSSADSTAIESFFVFALAWSFGGCLGARDRIILDQQIKESCSVRVPSTTLFDNFYDTEEKMFMKWDDLLKEFGIVPNIPFSRILVSTADTVRHSYILKKLMQCNLPTLLVGHPGTGKTVTIQNCLRTLDSDKNSVLTINFSSKTSSMEVQMSIEAMTDKRRPGLYGPKGNKRLVIFIDEMHMPQKDVYNTQQPIALLRFLIDRKLMYERGGQLELKEFKDLCFLGCLLPPGGGHNSLNPRFLSLFNIIDVGFPSEKNITKIYDTIILNHLKDFPLELRETGKKITQATLSVYRKICEKLPRTPVKFHYIFNLRDLSRVFQGMLRCNSQRFTSEQELVYLWKDEIQRVFCDRLMTKEDIGIVKDGILKEVVKAHFDKEVVKKVDAMKGHLVDFMLAEPVDEDSKDPKILEIVTDWDLLRLKCEDMLFKYNDKNHKKTMNLVLFRDAMCHLIRITRILGFPGGHGMMIGFGGSGKQSLIKLGGFIKQFHEFQISLKRNYKESNFKEDLIRLFHLLVEGKEVMFLLNDSHIIYESFLEYINSLLTVGVIDNLFEEPEKAEIRNELRDKSKRNGYGESADEVWEYFRDLVKNNLHIMLSMSPAGETLRRRCREFPGLINNATLDWFFEWPRDALKEVGQHVLKDVQVENREDLVDHCVFVHQNILVNSQQYHRERKRQNYATAKTYLDFLKSFETLVNSNKSKTRQKIEGLDKGLFKLVESAKYIAELKVTIAEEKKKVEEEKIEVEKLLVEITEKSKDASEKKQLASLKNAQLEEENKAIRQKQDETSKILAEKLPKLEKAQQQVSKIKKDELVYIKKLPSPPNLIKNTVACLQILKVNQHADESQGWQGAKTMLSDINLITTLLDFSKDLNRISKVSRSQMQKIDDRLKMINTELKEKNKTMNDVFSSCALLLCWVDAVKMLYDINQIVSPLKKTVQDLKVKKKIKEKELKETTDLLVVLNEELKKLTDKKKVKEEILSDLTFKVETMERKLSAAERLITDLGEEEVRWSQDMKELKSREKYLEGECMLAAGFLSYFGPFEQDFRARMLTQHDKDLGARGIQVRTDFRLEELLSSEVESAEWNSQGLPLDELSIQNGILTLQSSRYPFCIDPQLQAVEWLKKREGKELKVIVPSDESTFLRTIEQCIKYGKPLLIENMGEELDPLLDPILLQNFIEVAGKKKLVIGSEEIKFNPGFKLYMTCKLGNPKLTPEIMGKTSVINYSVTFSGLKEQLLNEVVGFEQEEKEQLRKKLVIEMSENKKLLADLENSLLESLGQSETNLLDNIELIETLDQTKKKSIFIDKALKEGSATRLLIEQARLNYIDIARRGAVLFFCMQKLSAISQMYEYSLSSYLEVFKRALVDAEQDNILNTRKNNIIEKLTLNVYDYVTLGLFERHKLMFSFQMTVMIMEESELFDKSLPELLDFFIKGNTSLDEPEMHGKPDWIPPKSWKDLLRLRSISPQFEIFGDSLQKNQLEWKIWADSAVPEDHPLPESFIKRVKELNPKKKSQEQNETSEHHSASEKVIEEKSRMVSEIPESENLSDSTLRESDSIRSKDADSETKMSKSKEKEDVDLAFSKFELLMILKVLRPDRVINGIKRFILDFFKPNEHFIQSPSPNLKLVWQQSNKKSPIVFILSPGADPISEVETLAEQEGFGGNKFRHLSLGQNMEEEAELLIENSAQRGHWAMLQNCDLLPRWLPHLEKILQKLEKPHPDFRLWLTTKPSKAFPIGILQRAIKIVTEPPDGLKQNIKSLTVKMTEKALSECEHPSYKPLNYVIMFFHAVLLNRKKFGKIGFNVEYDFNESDFRISSKLLSLYLNKSLVNQEAEMPWDSLKYLIGDAMYGGRVTDEFDERILKTYLDEYMGDFLFDKNNKFGFAKTKNHFYSLPMFSSLEQLQTQNNQLPIFDEPIIFGLHANAEITYFSNAAKEMWGNLIKMTNFNEGSGSVLSVSERVAHISSEISEKLPLPFNVVELKSKASKNPSSTYIVLLQEIERFNVLLECMTRSLLNLNRALSGEIAMSSEIERLVSDLNNGFLPMRWKSLCPQTNLNLASWMTHFRRRYQQYLHWSQKGTVNVMWLAGLHIPESYLTAVIQICCRKKKWALDKVKLRTRLTDYKDRKEVRNKLELGCYVEGLYMEGASWCESKKCIIPQRPKELIKKLPLMEIVPVERRKLKGKNSIKIPVYVTQDRGNKMGEGLVFTADLTSYEHESHWILQGVAIVLNKD